MTNKKKEGVRERKHKKERDPHPKKGKTPGPTENNGWGVDEREKK